MKECPIKALATIAGVDAGDECVAGSLALLLDSCAEAVAPGPNLFRPAPAKIRDELEKARVAAHALKSALDRMSPEARLWLKAEPVMAAERELYRSASMSKKLELLEEKPLSSEESADAFLAKVAPSESLSLPALRETLDRLVSSLGAARDAQQYRAFIPKVGAVDAVAIAGNYWRMHTKWKLSASDYSRFRQFVDVIFDHLGMGGSDVKKTVINGIKLTTQTVSSPKTRVSREKMEEYFDHFFSECSPDARESIEYLIGLTYDQCDGDVEKAMETVAAMIAAEKGDRAAKDS